MDATGRIGGNIGERAGLPRFAVTPSEPRLRLGPLGVRLAVRSESQAALSAVETLCRDWDAPLSGSQSELALTLHLSEARAVLREATLRPSGEWLRVHGGGVCGSANARLGEAECIFSPEWLNSGRLGPEVIEPLLLFLLSHADRTPIHASAFLLGDLCLILAGPSGAGKSALALAAQRAGFPVLSDDMVHIQLRPQLRIWGLPRPIHVFPSDARLAERGRLRWRNGKLKCPVPLAGDGTIVAERAVLCVLDRGTTAKVEVVSAPPSPDRLPPLERGFDLLPGQSQAAMQALSARGHARLSLSDNPDEAIAALVSGREALGAVATR